MSVRLAARAASRIDIGYFFASGSGTGADWPATNGYFAKMCSTAALIDASRFCCISLVTTPQMPPWNTTCRFSRSTTSITSVPTL